MREMIVFDVEWQDNEKALTAGELIDILKEYDKDTPVAATWEGVYSPLLARRISTDPVYGEY